MMFQIIIDGRYEKTSSDWRGGNIERCHCCACCCYLLFAVLAVNIIILNTKGKNIAGKLKETTNQDY